jgi:hypothetical protein
MAKSVTNSCFDLAEIMPAELADDVGVRAHAIVRTWLRGDVEGLVALVGDDADELLPTRDAVRLCYHGGDPPARFLAYSPDRS